MRPGGRHRAYFDWIRQRSGKRMGDAQPHWYAPVLAAGVRAAALPQG
jgi:hypothetical protein